MFRKSLICAIFIIFLSLPARSEWSIQKNSDLATTGVYGWSISLPEGWFQLPDIKPAWPEGAGYSSPNGTCSVEIVKASRPTETEQEQLCRRGWQMTQRQVKAYNMIEFLQSDSDKLKRLLYITTPKGEYRLALTHPHSELETMDKILKSFTFINNPNAKQVAPWPTFNGPENLFTMAHPQDYSVQLKSDGFTISKDGKAILKGQLYENCDPPAQSFRGMARRLGLQFRPESLNLVKFSPYEIGDITAYEIIGQQKDKIYYGPLVYIPLRHEKWKVLECYLVEPSLANEFFRIINTTKVFPKE